MTAEVLNDTPERTIAFIFEQGDEVMTAAASYLGAPAARVRAAQRHALIRIDA